MSSRIEGLPSELLHEIGNYLWDDLSAIRSLRLSSSRLSAFGPLMEEVSVYTTKESFERLAAIAEHHILRTQVLTAVCWVPFLYETFTKRNAYDQRVKQRSDLCFMPIRRRRAFDVTAESSTSSDTLLEQTMDNHHNAAILASEALKADPDQAYADYDRYYSEQQEILQHEFVNQLSTALAAFPRLHTVEVALPENAADSLKPQQFKHILYNVGMQCPNHYLYHIGTQRSTRNEHPRNYLFKLIHAIADSGKSLQTFIVDKGVWNIKGRGYLSRSLPMTATEYEGMRKVFHPLRHLAYGLTPGSGSRVRVFDTNELMSLTPLLEYLNLSMDHQQLQMALPAGLTWPRLKTFKFFHGDVEADALMEFLVRHLPTLTTVEISCVDLMDGPWKPVLGLLRAEPKSTNIWDNGEKDSFEDAPVIPKQRGYKAKVELIREGFGEEPFQGGDDEGNVLDLFLSGCGAWDWRLESVYG